jgi:hypothetical protein
MTRELDSGDMVTCETVEEMRLARLELEEGLTIVSDTDKTIKKYLSKDITYFLPAAFSAQVLPL